MACTEIPLAEAIRISARYLLIYRGGHNLYLIEAYSSPMPPEPQIKCLVALVPKYYLAMVNYTWLWTDTVRSLLLQSIRTAVLSSQGFIYLLMQGSIFIYHLPRQQILYIWSAYWSAVETYGLL